MWFNLTEKILEGDYHSLARAISLVENEVNGYEDFMMKVGHDHKPTIIGITGPPGVGKSTLTDALISQYVQTGLKVGVLCVDPSSPFHLGAILGDRIRMGDWHNNKNVFIRSLASRGSLGGLNPMIIEITDILKFAGFDKIIIETVGVGQSEIDVVRLADVSVVVLSPESGDEIQLMKAGLMEIADVFVVNKADRPGVDLFVKNITTMLSQDKSGKKANAVVVKTIAQHQEGVDVLQNSIDKIVATKSIGEISELLIERAYQLIAKKRMKDISRLKLKEEISSQGEKFNLYQFIQKY